MLMSGDIGCVSTSIAAKLRTKLYTVPTTAVQKIMRMAALDGRQRCLQEHDLELACCLNCGDDEASESLITGWCSR